MTRESNENLTPSFYLTNQWNIIPVIHNTKGRSPIKWSERRSRKTFNDEIPNLFREDSFNHFGAGIICGEFNNLILIDIDDPTIAKAFIAQDHCVIQTSKDHYSALIQWDKDIPDFIQDDKNKAEFSVKTSDKSIAVLPPTINDKGTYKFIRTWVNFVHPKPLSPKNKQELIEKIDSYKVMMNEKGTVPKEEFEGYTMKGRISEGGRNNKMSHIAGVLINKNGFGDGVEDKIREEMHKINKNFFSPALLDREVDIIFRSVINGHKERHPEDNGKRYVEDKRSVAMGKIKRFRGNKEGLLRDLEKEVVKFTPYRQINHLISVMRLGRIYTIYGLPNCGKSSIARLILEANPRHNPAYIFLENTMDTMDETEFSQWMFKKGYYPNQYYMKDYTFSLAFNEILRTKEEHEEKVKEFLLEAHSTIGNFSFEDNDVKSVVECIKSMKDNGCKLIVLDSTTLLDQSNKNGSYTDGIRYFLAELMKISEDLCIILIAHSTEGEKGNKPYGSTHYLNFCHGVFEVRDAKDLTMVKLDALHREIVVHKNRPERRGYAVQYSYSTKDGLMDDFREVDVVDKSEEREEKPRKTSKLQGFVG